MNLRLLPLLLFPTLLWGQDYPFIEFTNESCHVGLKDQKGKEILSANYRQIRIESVGNDWLISAQERDRGTYILYQNNKAIPLKYPEIEKFNEQLLLIESNRKYGLVNTKGVGIALIQYDRIRPLGSQYAMTSQQGMKGVIRNNGKAILPNKYESIKYWEAADCFLVLKEGVWSVCDTKGKVIGRYTNVHLDYDLSPFLVVNKDGKSGLLDKKGTLKLPIEYQGIGCFPNGWLKIKNEGTWLLCDENRKLITDKRCESIYYMPDAKCFRVTGKNNQVGVLDEEGRSIIPTDYKMYLTAIQGQLICLQSLSNKMHIYDVKNKKWIAKEADNIDDVKACSDAYDCLWIKKDQKWQLVDAALKPILEETYKRADQNDNDYVNLTNEANLVGLFSHKSNTLLLPHEYTAIQVRGSFFKVKKAGTGWFYVNEKNERMDCK